MHSSAGARAKALTEQLIVQVHGSLTTTPMLASGHRHEAQAAETSSVYFGVTYLVGFGAGILLG